jgi:hypothetical protein
LNRTIIIIAIAFASCRSTSGDQLISNKTSISWGQNHNRNSSYVNGTQILKSNLIPDTIFQMPYLTSLAITGMDCDFGNRDSCWMIRAIPKAIKQLTNLRSLMLNVNAIKTIPPEIVFLTKLTLLDLSDNPPLENIDYVTQLTQLENLLLYGCHLRTLPAGIKKMKQLKVLGIRNNPIPEAEVAKLMEAMPWCRIEF